MHEWLSIPLSTPTAIINTNINVWNGCKLASKRMQVHVVPTDGEGDHKEPSDHGLGTSLMSHKMKLFGRVAQKQPLLSTISKTKHLEFAKLHWKYNWKRVG